MIDIGVKVFTDRDSLAKKSGGNRDWNAFIRIKDDVTLEFVYLDDLRDDTSDDHKVVQWYEYNWVEGTTNGKTFNVNIPSGEDDPQDLQDNHQTKYQYASNIFIVRVFLTNTKQECEVDGTPLRSHESWGERPIEDRIRVLASGKSTSNDFLSKLTDWEDDEEGAPGHLMRLSRAKDGNFTNYELRYVKPYDAKLDGAQIEEYRFDIRELLTESREFGLRHCGFVKVDKPELDDAVPKNSDNLQVEGDGGSDDIFDDAATGSSSKSDFNG